MGLWDIKEAKWDIHAVRFCLDKSPVAWFGAIHFAESTFSCCGMRRSSPAALDFCGSNTEPSVPGRSERNSQEMMRRKWIHECMGQSSKIWEIEARRSRNRWVMHWRKWAKHGTFYLFKFERYFWVCLFVFFPWIEGEKRKDGRIREEENANCPRKPIPDRLSLDFLKVVFSKY